MYTNLYFLAVLPPAETASAVDKIKLDFAANYGATKAVKVLPHITLKAPFTIDANRHAEITNWFNGVTTEIPPFDIRLNGFGAFDNAKNPVIFIKPEPNDSLHKLQKKVLIDFATHLPEIKISYIEKDFNPHMTIAYRDLTREQFEQAWPKYKESQFEATFRCSSFWLLRHNGRQWVPLVEKALQ